MRLQVGTPDLGAQYHSDTLYVGLTWLAPGLRFLFWCSVKFKCVFYLCFGVIYKAALFEILTTLHWLPPPQISATCTRRQ